jgi:hypothetical protein
VSKPTAALDGISDRSLSIVRIFGPSDIEDLIDRRPMKLDSIGVAETALPRPRNRPERSAAVPALRR